MKEHKCTKCGEVKPLTTEYFCKRKDNKFGWRKDCKVCQSKRRRRYYLNNLEEHKKYMAEYRSTEEYRIRKNERQQSYMENPLNRLKKNLRYHVTKGLVNNKLYGTEEILGCTWEFFRDYIEEQFRDGMTWDNYGIHGWHLDHIIPLATAKTDKEIYRLNHYTNLQPLWAEENLKKGDKIFDFLEIT